MKVHSADMPYLTGEKLSSGKRFKIGGCQRFVSRETILTELVRNKSVLHVGCADHMDEILKKRESNCYLHDLLATSAEKLVGVDTNQEALNTMKSIGMELVYHPDEFPENSSFDYVLIPDVIEHVENVKEFLLDISKYRSKYYVFTTPNAYRLQNRLLFQSELINTDHRYWFSPYTILKCLIDSGYIIEGFYYTDKMYLRSPLKSLIKFLFPICRDGLVITCSRE